MIGLGSYSQLGIGIAIELQDKFSATSDRVSRKLRELKGLGNSSVNAAVRDYRNNATAIAATSGAVTWGFYSMAKSASEFGHRINQIDIIGGGRLGKTKQQLSDFALGLSRDFGTLPKDVGAAMLENTRAGVTSGLDMITKYQLATAKAVGEDASSVAQHLLGTANAMNVPLNDFPRVANAVTAAANASMASVFSIGESMEYAAFTAAQFNIPLEQTLALVSKLSQSQIKGSAAGTALNNMIQYLGTSLSDLATPKQIKMWDKLGLNRKEMKGMMDSGNIFGVIEALDKAMQSISPSERLSILRGITNMRGARGMLGSWGSSDPNKTLTALLGDIKGGVKNDIAIKQSKAMMDDPYSQFQRVQAAWETFKIRFIGAMAPALMKILKASEGFLDFTSKIAATPLGGVLGTIVAVGAPLVTILFGFRAAALATTIALNGLTRGIGFRSLLGASLGNLGASALTSTLAGRGVQGATNVKLNKYGNPYVKAGGEVLYNGKLYTGGQALPKALLGTQLAMGGAGMGTAAGGFMTKLAGKIGGSVGSKVIPFLARGTMIAARFLPIIGWGLTLWSIYDVVKGMRSDRQKENAERLRDPAYNFFKTAMDAELLKYSNPGMSKLMQTPEWQKAKEDFKAANLKQNITVNIDSNKIFERSIDQTLDGNITQQLPFNLTY